MVVWCPGTALPQAESPARSRGDDLSNSTGESGPARSQNVRTSGGAVTARGQLDLRVMGRTMLLMTIIARTSDPSGLLTSILEAIDGDNETGESISTWSYDEDGKLKHSETANNVQEAWFRPEVLPDDLSFHLVKGKAPSLDAFSYGYHHGKLVQMLLHHFSDRVRVIAATPWKDK